MDQNDKLELTVVALRDATVSFGSSFTLGPLSFGLCPGVTALLGPNGAGKSTLIRALAGIQRISSGYVSSPSAPRGAGYLPQQFRAPQWATPADYLRYVAWVHRVPRAERIGAVDRALAAVGLEDRANHRIRSLSGGMLRRLGVAQAIVHSPELVLLDEPTAGLDHDQRLALISVIRRIARESAVVVSTHVLDDVARLGERVIVLDAGRIDFVGSMDDVVTAGAKIAGDTSITARGPDIAGALEALVRGRGEAGERA
ncbi:ABC transporter ATP-binding protein [Luteipulveratus sp. YIM 133132]|uniref:ABC transporter ATP-binding protein n=1 Tax=Luteipulveratus flavus TaxID=3031728 RepID=UPI0023B1DC7C|nr:ABC transporter ATP-binding protein [Luteipulveratus sp. YIM 133132]MDE9367889.1 ABC transporter ATP-binding protein [Luteipulveratus sp. YIM 133132]